MWNKLTALKCPLAHPQSFIQHSKDLTKVIIQVITQHLLSNRATCVTTRLVCTSLDSMCYNTNRRPQNNLATWLRLTAAMYEEEVGHVSS